MKRKVCLLVMTVVSILTLCACSAAEEGGLGTVVNRGTEQNTIAEDEKERGSQTASENGSDENFPSEMDNVDTTPGAADEFDIHATIEGAEEQAIALSQKVVDAISQDEMEEAAKGLYELWDKELNDIWRRLKNTLSEEDMSKLITEERDWIEWKEAEAEAAGSPYEASGLMTLIVYQKEARLTRERVYELAEYLGEITGQTVPALETEDYSGLYVDTMGTPGTVYSELYLEYLGDGLYETSVSLFRLGRLDGKAEENGEVLLFEDLTINVKGEIRFQDTGAVLTITESGFKYLHPGDICTFSEKLY